MPPHSHLALALCAGLCAALGGSVALAQGPVATFGRELEGAVSLQRRPRRVVLGRGDWVQLTVESPDSERPWEGLEAAVSVGEIAPAEAGEGRAVIRWRLPRRHFPQRALIALWWAGAPARGVSFFSVPLYGVATLPVRTDPGGEVTAKVGGRSFGPERAGDSGQVAVRVELGPEQRRAQVIARLPGGGVTRETVTLPPAPFPRALAVPLAWEEQPQLLVFAPGRRGRAIALSSSVGALALVGAAGEELAHYRLEGPEPLFEVDGEATVSAKVEGAPGPAASARLSWLAGLGPPPPDEAPRDEAPPPDEAPPEELPAQPPPVPWFGHPPASLALSFHLSAEVMPDPASPGVLPSAWLGSLGAGVFGQVWGPLSAGLGFSLAGVSGSDRAKVGATALAPGEVPWSGTALCASLHLSTQVWGPIEAAASLELGWGQASAEAVNRDGDPVVFSGGMSLFGATLGAGVRHGAFSARLEGGWRALNPAFFTAGLQATHPEAGLSARLLLEYRLWFAAPRDPAPAKG